jgi:hypothetical protein
VESNTVSWGNRCSEHWQSNGQWVVCRICKVRCRCNVGPSYSPDQRIVTVISGTYYFAAGTEFDESKLKPMKTGTTLIVPANAPHYAQPKNGETIVQEIGIGPSGTNIWPKAAAK